MKYLYRSIFLIITSFLLITGCEKENSGEITGRLTGYTGCKSYMKITSEKSETSDNLSCVEYSYNELTHILTMKHINAGFNCCPESLYCDISCHSGVITITEHETMSLCDCNCLFDLYLVIQNVEEKEYQVNFIEPYAGEQEKLVFNIDLTENKNGLFCVTRELYPWNIVSYNN